MGNNDSFGDNPRRVGVAERWWAPVKLKLTEDYDYVTKNGFIKFLYYIVLFGGLSWVYLFSYFYWGFRITGKENVKSLKNTSAITVSNHVHDMDSPMLTRAFLPDTPYFVALKHNFEMFFLGGIVRILRGVPLPPPDDVKCFLKFQEDVNNVLQTTKHKVHIYPEASIEPYCRQLRNFKKGAFYFAIRNNVPVLPMVFVYPKPKRLRLIIGKPIYPKDIEGIENMKEPFAVVAIAKKTRSIMQQMMDDFYGGLLHED
jgi:1-acyl-sn-glycerol-3-phosphate acyltransferase